MKKLRLYLVPAVIVAMVAGCVSTVFAGAENQVRSLINAAGLRGAKVSVMAIDVNSGESLVDIDVDEPMTPASNMKLVTTAAALRILGSDYLFQTDLILAGGGMNDAVLLVRGDGDPSFGDPKLLEQHGYDVDMLVDIWVKAIADAGVKQVAQLLVDDRVFDQQFVHPDWPEDQLNNWYCAQVAGLNFHDNCLDLFPRPTRPGHSPVVVMRPSAPFLEVLNRAVTDSTDSFWVSRKLSSNDLTYRGKVKTEHTAAVNVTLHDPPMFFVQLLAHRLHAKGIATSFVGRPGAEDRLSAGRVLHRIQTPMPVVLSRCNKDSQNLFAEALIKRMGHEITGSPGSWSNGAAAIRKFLHERLGARGASIQIADGSGMSRSNAVTARLLVDLLADMHRDTNLGPIYRESLSTGGEDGTLRKRFANGMRGQVYGKSGYISEVSSLSGYIVFNDPDDDAGAQPQKTIAFSLLFNGFKPPIYNPQVKHVQNQIVQLLDRLAAPAEARLGG